eukprot:5805125-Amphidinium_carterae.3
MQALSPRSDDYAAAADDVMRLTDGHKKGLLLTDIVGSVPTSTAPSRALDEYVDITRMSSTWMLCAVGKQSWAGDIDGASGACACVMARLRDATGLGPQAKWDEVRAILSLANRTSHDAPQHPWMWHTQSLL